MQLIQLSNVDHQGVQQVVASLDKPVLLNSSPAGAYDSRYDIYAAEPVAHVTYVAGELTTSDPELMHDQGNLFHCINQLRDKYLPKPHHLSEIDEAPPFCGGLLGYLGYPRLQGRSNFHAWDAFVGVYYWALIFDHQSSCYSLVFHEQCTLQQRERITALIEGSANQENPANSVAQFELLTPFQNCQSETQYRHSFDKIMDYIQAGDCYQANLTQQLRAECRGEPFAAYQLLQRTANAPFSAYLNWGPGALLSVSPERLLGISALRARSQPIKGTRPRSLDLNKDQALAEELVASAKDRAENLMIVDLIRNDFGRECKTGSVHTDRLFELQSFHNVHHLVSSVSGELEDDDASLRLFESCFPGGSITGAPKLRAMEIIEETEVNLRRSYCGSVFYFSACGNFDSNITIRSLLWQQDHLLAWAGGGIVADSQWQSEYQECFDKINSLIKVLEKLI